MTEEQLANLFEEKVSKI